MAHWRSGNAGVCKTSTAPVRFRHAPHIGEVSEWFKELVLKTSVGVSLPGVRISPSPPRITFRKIKVGSLGAKRLGMIFFRYFEGIFEIARQRAVGNAEVRTNLFEKIPNPFGIFLLSVFFGLVSLF